VGPPQKRFFFESVNGGKEFEALMNVLKEGIKRLGVVNNEGDVRIANVPFFFGLKRLCK
jgi:hypothetical protein